MDEKFRKLIELGAGDFELADAKLIAHLEGTRCLLKEWHGSDDLQQAGLYHAAYGTSHISQSIFNLSQRKDVAAVIGDKPEKLVYLYFACQTAPFFAQFGEVEQPIFYDRLTNSHSALTPEQLANLCELFAAKEIDLVIYQPEYATKHAKRLMDLFGRMQGFLSLSARRKIEHVFAAKA